MIYEPREITCRDGRSCILRSAAVTDANDLIRYLKVTAGETPFLIREPDEISLTPEQEEHFIEGIVKEPRELMLIGTVAGEHVGNCSLMSLGNYERYAPVSYTHLRAHETGRNLVCRLLLEKKKKKKKQ